MEKKRVKKLKVLPKGVWQSTRENRKQQTNLPGDPRASAAYLQNIQNGNLVHKIYRRKDENSFFNFFMGPKLNEIMTSKLF